MRRFIYVSRWTEAVHADPDLVLQQIVARSIRNNRMHDITGFLLAYDALFLQALEGPKAQVEAAYARIEQDPRHDRLTIIDDSVANARQFRDWNMCGVSLDDAGLSLAAARQSVIAAQGRFDATGALDLLRDVALAEARRERAAALPPPQRG